MSQWLGVFTMTAFGAVCITIGAAKKSRTKWR